MHKDGKENRISPAYIADMICEHFNSWGINAKAITVIIMGRPGPTGKTWLCENLTQKGFNAIELDLEHCKVDIQYHDNKNHYKIENHPFGNASTVYVVLNEILPQYRDMDEVESLYPKTVFMHHGDLKPLDTDCRKALKHLINKQYGAAIGNPCYGMTGGYTIPPLHGKSSHNGLPSIDKVIYNDPATIVLWKDGSKTVVKAQDGEPYDDEKGLAMAISKKALGNKGNYYNTFDKFLIRPEEEEYEEVKENNYPQYGVPMAAFYDITDDVTKYTCPVCGAIRYDEGKTDEDRGYYCNHKRIACKKSDDK